MGDKLLLVVWGAVLGMVLTGCKGCTEQHDPRPHWKQFRSESAAANAEQPKLNGDGTLPIKVEEVEEAGDNSLAAVEKKYQGMCATCHGANGNGEGVASNPPPRNFTDAKWQDSVTDEHIAKVIREGGVSVGLSAMMAPWGSLLSDEEIQGMVQVVRNFKK